MKARSKRIWAITASWLATLCAFSGSAFGYERTGGVLETVLRWVYPEVSYIFVNAVNTALRKCAHVSVYAWLTVLTLVACGPLWPRRLFRVVLFVLVCASLDETHQLFQNSRGGHLGDVIWDMGGCLAGLAAWGWWQRQKEPAPLAPTEGCKV